MMIKGHTHSAVVYNYFFAKGAERRSYRRGSKVFYEGDVLYSFGTHFELAVKCRNNGYVLNGDRYSSTTSGHQSLTRSVAERHKQETTNRVTHHCIIPFSALQAAEVKPEDVFILDVTEDTWETVKRKNPKTGEMEEHQIHHLGASLVRVGTKRYLSSIDNSSRRYMFYLVELKSRRVNTVEDAFRDLAGSLSDEQYERYLLGEIKRQGEYFLEPRSELITRELKKKAKKTRVKLEGILDVKVKTPHSKRVVKEVIRRENMGYGGIGREQIQVMRQRGVPYYVLLDRGHAGLIIPKGAIIRGNSMYVGNALVKQFDLSHGIGNPHVARDAIQTPDGLFVQGTLRHTEHRMIRMNNTWHRVYKNTARGSWSASGNVD